MAFDFDRALAAQGKALGPHPAFMDRLTPVSVYSPGKPREDAVISQREASRHSDAYGGQQAIDWVYDCIGLYADAASTAAYGLKRPDGIKMVKIKTAGTPPEYKVGPQELYALLDKPNPFMLYDELMSLLVIDLFLVGNGYWFKWRTGNSGRPLALYRLAPSHVKIVPGEFGVKRYEYQPPGAKEKLLIDPQEVIHFKRPNPHSAYYGMGVIQGAGRSMDLELAITDTMAAYYENRADPSMIIQSERRVPRDVFNKLRAQLRIRTAGSRNAGELLVLEAGLKASSLSTSAADALFADLSKMSRDRIFAKFRASPMLFGLLDEQSGSNKVSDVRREFDNSSIRPFLSKLSTKITASLVSAWDLEFNIEHRSYLPADEAIKVAESIAAAPGIKIREVRKQYEQFGIEESTGDPEIDNFVLNKPGPEMDANGNVVDPITGKVVPGQQVNAADRNLGSEPGRPPKGNTRGFGVAKAGKKSLPDLLAELEGKAMNTAGERVTIGNRLPDEQRPDDPFLVARGADINAAARFIEDGLRDAATQLERDLLDHVEGKALKTSDLVGRVKKSDAWTTFKERVARVLEEGALRSASSGVIHSGLTPDDDVDYDELAKSIVNRPDGLRSIVRTLRDRIVRRLKDTRSENGERHDFEATVRDEITNWTRNQASLIAETEAVHAYNEATLTAAELSGVNLVFVTDGDDHDQPCKDADGSVWEIEHARKNRLEHPRCRRAFIPLTAPAVA